MRFHREKPVLDDRRRQEAMPLAMPDLLASPVGLDTDTSVLTDRLRDAFEQYTQRRIGRREFERWLADVEVAVWQQVQESTPPNTLAYADLSCLLAYYGIDYLENLCRLFQTFRLLPWQPERYPWFFFEKGQGADVRTLPAHLRLLYVRYRDPELLGILLDLQMEAVDARESQMDLIASLWEEYPTALLMAASQSLHRLYRLLSALARVALTVNDPLVWKAYYRMLQRIVYRREQRLMRVAWRLIAALRRLQLRSD